MSTIVIYTNNSCPNLSKMTNFFDSRQVSYVVKNINHDFKARTEALSKRIFELPAIVFNDQILIGFDESKLNALLN